MSIKVAVRVRPFNSREQGDNCVITMVQNSTSIECPENHQKRQFTFDYSFWSHDSFITEEDGYLRPEPGGPYCDQAFVFDKLGKAILDNAWEGYNCCLFAYGQTGSGKSYSMVGYGANKGIVPISCEEIFTRIENNTDNTKEFEVEVSMLEIYNEKVQDLLIPPNKRNPSGLKIRESKTLGVFVDGLSEHPVGSYKQISDKMEEGYENRTIGSTNMNATSSRAHTIVTIKFKQVTKVGNDNTVKVSNIHLVDLAGSERAGSTGATGERLKEGCNINKSLLVLGNVINALADKAMGKKKDVLPPYRDSALTRILQNALGGNSKTVMICALSPASMNYEETLSTLRYADRAKKIQNKAVINEDPKDKTLRLLKEENNELKKQLEELSKKLMLGGPIEEEDKKAFIELQEQFKANESIADNMTKSFKDRLEEAKKNDAMNANRRVDITKPHLVVLNQDPQLSHKLKYPLTTLPFHVGRKLANPPPDIVLFGIGIKMNHAVFEKGKNEGEIVLKPSEAGAMDKIIVNGYKLESMDGVVLNNKDKIIFGTNSIMVFFTQSDGKDLYEFDWESVLEEYETIADEDDELDQIMKCGEMGKMEEKFNQEKEEIEKKFKAQIEEYQNKLNQMSQNQGEKEEITKKRDELEAQLKKKISQLEKENKSKKRIAAQNEVTKRKGSSTFVHQSETKENTLLNIYKKLFKLKNIIADLRRNIDCDLFLTKNLIDYFNDPDSPLITLIRVENYEEGSVYYWTSEAFENRYESMKELYKKFLYENYDLSKLSQEEDPLYDKKKETLLGYSFYKLEPLAHLTNNFSGLSVISLKGTVVGTLYMDIIPTDENGNDSPHFKEDPQELLAKNLHFKVYFKECIGLPDNFNKGLRIEYTSFHDNNIYKTQVHNANEGEGNIDINESFQHSFEYLTQEDIDFLIDDKLCIKVYGFEEVEKKGKNKIPNREEILKEKMEVSEEKGVVKTEDNQRFQKEADKYDCNII